MAHFPSRSDTGPGPSTPFPDTPGPMWGQLVAHTGYEQQRMAGANLPSDPDGPFSFGGFGTSQTGFQGNVVSIFTFGT